MNATRMHLKGVVSIWLANGNKPVEGMNDTRYDYFPGDEIEAYEATVELVEDGFLEWSGERVDPTYGDPITYPANVIPTARGIFEVLS